MSNLKKWMIEEDLYAELWEAGDEAVESLRVIFPTCTGVTRLQVHGSQPVKASERSEDRLSTAPSPENFKMRWDTICGWIETWLIIERPQKATLIAHGLVMNFVNSVVEEVSYYEVPRNVPGDLSDVRRDSYTALRRRMWCDLLSPVHLLETRWIKEAEGADPFQASYTRTFSQADTPVTLADFEIVLSLVHPLTEQNGRIVDGDVCGLIEVVPSTSSRGSAHPECDVRVRVAMTAQWRKVEYLVVHEMKACVQLPVDAPLAALIQAAYADIATCSLDASNLPGAAWVFEANEDVSAALYEVNRGIDLAGGSHYADPTHSTLGHLPWGWLFFAARKPPADAAMPQLPGEEE
jgi:hypothetical protein